MVRLLAGEAQVEQMEMLLDLPVLPGFMAEAVVASLTMVKVHLQEMVAAGLCGLSGEVDVRFHQPTLAIN